MIPQTLKHFLAITLIANLICCKSSIENKEENRKSDPIKIVGRDSIRRRNKTVNHFSSDIKKDTFLIELKGTYVTKANVAFKIISFENKIIDSDEFPMMYLYGWGPDIGNSNPDSLIV